MKLAYTIWTWGLESEDSLRTALADISAIGYKNFENFVGMAGLFAGREDEFLAICEEYGVKFVCLYNYVEDMDADNLTPARKYLEFCRKTGCDVMNIQAPNRRKYNTPEDIVRLAGILNDIGAEANRYGVKLALHPHYETLIETSEEVDAIAALLDEDKVGFCFDTAHTVLGGEKPEDLIRRYGSRVRYIHLKDLPADLDHEAYRKNWLTNFNDFQRFFELGTGGVDFRAVYTALEEAGYDGILCTELDTPSENNRDGAKTNYDFVMETLPELK